MSSSNKLHQQSCEACKQDAPLVPTNQYPELLKQIPEWDVVANKLINQLRRTYSFSNFLDAMTFANKISELAEDYNHHPELRIEWGKVTVFWWTHKIFGLHMNDFVMAAKCDQLYHP